jgi:hypothetical protein
VRRLLVRRRDGHGFEGRHARPRDVALQRHRRHQRQRLRQTACKKLAQKNPRKAVDNADSHEYFAENNPAQTEQQPGRCLAEPLGVCALG